MRAVIDLKAEPLLRIASGAHVLELAPAAGGRITRFSTRDDRGVHDWLVPITASNWPCDAWPKGGSYPLVPFSNRVRDARFPAPDGARIELATFPGMAHALHGFGQYAPWSVERHDADCIEMRYVHRASEHGWPWAFDAIQTIRATAEGAHMSMRVVNRSSQPMPAGFGFHPYFAAERAELDASTLWRHEAEIALGPSDDAPPRRHVKESGGYTRYLSGWVGRATLSYANGRTLALTADAALGHAIVHCPAGGAYLCVEPVSHVSDGFNLDAQGIRGTGVVVVPAGGEIAASLAMTVTAGV
ncbi:aldose epimerase [Caballeronia sp. Lep1P3]|uniref:aldose epimerase family protein n=1 Tax=Caballeronia sp. Lep1P3 TaxID=2878150 RepID=UPI001FD44E27|nr:aldose epimerase [Caballeronia sp. Lep1P3]